MKSLSTQLKIESDLSKAFFYKKESGTLIVAANWLIYQIRDHKEKVSTFFLFRFLQVIINEWPDYQKAAYQYEELCKEFILVSNKLGAKAEVEKVYAELEHIRVRAKELSPSTILQY